MAAATPTFPTWRERPNYTCVDFLGEGAFGKVYGVLDTAVKPPTMVAIKVVKTPGVVAPLEKELAALRAIRSHPYIIHYLDTFRSDEGHMCIVTELAHNGNLRKFVEEQGLLLTLKDRVQLMVEIMLGVEYLHGIGKGIIHGYIKPASVLVYSHILMPGMGHAALAEFGEGKAVNDTSEPLLRTPPASTRLYTAPEVVEQLEWEPHVVYSQKADIWSCGVVFFWLLAGLATSTGCADELAGNPCYDPRMIVHAFQRNVFMDEPMWDRLPADLPENLRSLLKQMLHKEPTHRISARMALSMLMHILS